MFTAGPLAAAEGLPLADAAPLALPGVPPEALAELDAPDALAGAEALAGTAAEVDAAGLLAAADVEAGADDAGALAGAEELAGAGEVLTAAEPPQLASSTADSAIDAIVFFIWISS